MSPTSLATIAVFLVVILALVKPLGLYLSRVYAGEWTPLSPVLRPIERLIYRLCGVQPEQQQGWRSYATAFLAFHLPGMLVIYALVRLQDLLPLNPAGQPALPPDLALNTAVSFATNTSWQSYGGETTLSHLAQMAGITVQSFLSGAAGMTVAIALIRGLSRGASNLRDTPATPATIGNFWVDLTRGVLYVMLPISVLVTLLLAWQGVPQTLAGPVPVATLEGAHQLIAAGPVAQSAHPLENPTFLSNMAGLLLMPLLGAALTNTFGRMVGRPREGWALLIAMLVMFAAGAVAMQMAEAHGNPLLAGIDQHLGNLEGKELRFGVAGSSLFAELATATSSGAVNSMHDSYMPLGGLVQMLNMKLGEVIFGGPGSGMFSILLVAVLAVFIGGLMIGRTPEYVGNKIEARDIKMTMIATLIMPALALVLTAVAVVLPAGLAGLGNAGPHGFSEVLYAYTSAANTNGSSFAGLMTNTPFYNLTLALAMLLGRMVPIIAVLALAGSLATKRRAPASAGTLPTTGPLWVSLVVGVTLILGGLTYFPVLALGPVAEHLAMQGGAMF
jgi:K+-transporting ATPase ATPase A chain